MSNETLTVTTGSEELLDEWAERLDELGIPYTRRPGEIRHYAPLKLARPTYSVRLIRADPDRATNDLLTTPNVSRSSGGAES